MPVKAQNKKAVCITCFQHHYETRTKYVQKQLEASGFNVTLLVSDFDHIKKKYSEGRFKNAINIHVPSYNKNISVSRILSHFIFAFRVYKQVLRIKPNYIYYLCPPNSPLLFIKKYKKKNECKLIIDIYDCWPESFPHQKLRWLFRIPFFFWKRFRDKHLDCADKIICVSSDCAAYIKSLHPKATPEVLLPFIEASQNNFYNSNIDDHIEICYLGSINHLFDIQLNIGLLTAINRKFHVVLHLIGEGENIEHFIEECKKHEIEIIRHGIIYDWEQKQEIFRQCNLGLNIYKTSAHVTMTLKSVEYLKAGLPFFNNAFGDTEEMIRKYKVGINIKEFSFEEIANLLARLGSDGLKKMHENCLTVYHDNFSCQNISCILEIE